MPSHTLHWPVLTRGARDACNVPALVIGASYLGFGALVRETGLTVWQGLLSTATGWALPGQVVLIELYALATPLLMIMLAVGLTNARLLPMTVTVMPWLRAPAVPRWAYFLAAHLVAVTGWVQAMRVCPRLPQPERLPYFLGFGLVLWGTTLCATAGGFLLAAEMPRPLALALVFLNPIYFLLIMSADLQHRSRQVALAVGLVLGPLLHLLTPQWGLLLTGLIAGSLGFLAGRLPRAAGGTP